jgi:DMSO/TMAO reductase YedYZ molybdopterin-dependent catalytic subunit
MRAFIADKATEKKYRRTSLISFIIFILMGLIVFSIWEWLAHQPNEKGEVKAIPAYMRNVLDFNEEIYSGIYSTRNLIKEYPKKSAVKKVRVNGDIGMGTDNFDPLTWKLQVVKKNGDTLRIGLDEIKKLPKIDVVYNFKCIEGWSQITWWSGVRFTDFVKKFGLEKEIDLKYVGMNTPDNKYFIGVDMPSMIHPQTILCYELNGKELPMNQGYPLRLIIPVKYGVKHLKRIGTITFSDIRPPDYWAQKGYDYYTGL